jgi:hypothetical protein
MRDVRRFNKAGGVAHHCTQLVVHLCNQSDSCKIKSLILFYLFHIVFHLNYFMLRSIIFYCIYFMYY